MAGGCGDLGRLSAIVWRPVATLPALYMTVWDRLTLAPLRQEFPQGTPNPAQIDRETPASSEKRGGEREFRHADGLVILAWAMIVVHMKIAIVAVPYATDVAKWGHAGGPHYFLDHGLMEALQELTSW